MPSTFSAHIPEDQVTWTNTRTYN